MRTCSSRLVNCCLSCVRYNTSTSLLLPSLSRPRSLTHRPLYSPHVSLSCRSLSSHSSSSKDVPHYRDRADELNNPYRDLYRKPLGKRPVTFRERFIEAKKNEPKPRIGKGDKMEDFLSLDGGRVDKRRSFYQDGSRVRFGDVGVMPELASQIAELGVVHPTKHQCDVIPVLMQGNNCVFISPTGSGKTYTYLLPTIQSVLKSKQDGYITKSGAPRIIIMAPTKFLSLQIGLVVDHLIQDLQLRSVCLTQLTSSSQTREIQGHPIDILVGTYENITSWIGSGHVTTTDLQHLVVDEVDEFLDYRKVTDNLAFLREFCDEEDGSSNCQIVLAGAFMHQAGFKRLAEVVPNIDRYLNPKSHIPLPHVKQKFCFVDNKSKANHLVELLRRHLKSPNYETQRPLIFCNYSNTSYWLHKHLIQHDISNIHVGRQSTSKAKTRLMRQEIPNTTYPIVTTDSFGYGLDLRDVGLVINFEFPFTYEDYIRRSGRTGRLSTSSNACQIVSYVSYKRDKALYNIVKNSTLQNDCLSTVLLSTNKFGWLRK